MRYGLLAAGIATACLMGITTQSHAWTYVEDYVPSRYIACFEKHYVPARVLVNTRGSLVRPGGVAWEVSGGPTVYGVTVGLYERWAKVRVLPVYKEVRTVIAPDHYTLRRVGC